MTVYYFVKRTFLVLLVAAVLSAIVQPSSICQSLKSPRSFIIFSFYWLEHCTVRYSTTVCSQFLVRAKPFSGVHLYVRYGDCSTASPTIEPSRRPCSITRRGPRSPTSRRCSLWTVRRSFCTLSALFGPSLCVSLCASVYLNNCSEGEWGAGGIIHSKRYVENGDFFEILGCVIYSKFTLRKFTSLRCLAIIVLLCDCIILLFESPLIGVLLPKHFTAFTFAVRTGSYPLICSVYTAQT